MKNGMKGRIPNWAKERVEQEVMKYGFALAFHYFAYDCDWSNLTPYEHQMHRAFNQYMNTHDNVLGKKKIFVNSCQKTASGVRTYAHDILNFMSARDVPCEVHIRRIQNYYRLETANLLIYIFPANADMTGYRNVDEAFYYPAETAKYLYGDRYSQRYGGWLIDYIVEIEGGRKREPKEVLDNDR